MAQLSHCVCRPYHRLLLPHFRLCGFCLFLYTVRVARLVSKVGVVSISFLDDLFTQVFSSVTAHLLLLEVGRRRRNKKTVTDYSTIDETSTPSV